MTNRKYSKGRQDVSELPEHEFPNTVIKLQQDGLLNSTPRYHDTHLLALPNIHLHPPVGISQGLLA